MSKKQKIIIAVSLLIIMLVGASLFIKTSSTKGLKLTFTLDKTELKFGETINYTASLKNQGPINVEVQEPTCGDSHSLLIDDVPVTFDSSTCMSLGTEPLIIGAGQKLEDQQSSFTVQAYDQASDEQNLGLNRDYGIVGLTNGEHTAQYIWYGVESEKVKFTVTE